LRRRIIAGNWKMNLDHLEGETLARRIASDLAERKPDCEVVVIPPFTTIPAVAAALEGSGVRTGAQDLWYEVKGAFTGEISAGMIERLGCSYVLVGHSERRHIIGEKSGLLSKKLRAALSAQLSPIYCVGETFEEREGGEAQDVVAGQIREVLKGIGESGISRTVVAYEPVWAIGTGRTATPDDAGTMHGIIRDLVAGIFGGKAADAVPILYGGSVKPGNASELLAVEGIDGALVGGASLDADSFLGIIFAH
jgi:triosephosphate isomerase